VAVRRHQHGHHLRRPKLWPDPAMVNRGWLYADSGARACEERAPAQDLRALSASVRVAQEMGAGLGRSQVLLRGVSAWHTPRRAGPVARYLTTVGRPNRVRTG